MGTMVFLPMATYRSPQSLIAMIQRVQSPRGRRREGLFSIEGTRLVERALRSGAPLEAVLAAERLINDADNRLQGLMADLNAAHCPLTVVPDGVLDELTGGRDLGPVMGLVRLPEALVLGEIMRQGRVETTDRAPLLLAAVDIVDPGNVGALTRTAHAAGADAFLVGGVSDPYHPRATRISRGSIFRLPIVEYDSAITLLEDLRRERVFLVGTAARDGIPLPEVAWPHRATAILMGNEAEGLPAAIRDALDYNITIPMPDGVDSYSVNAAAAIVLYAAAQARDS